MFICYTWNLYNPILRLDNEKENIYTNQDEVYFPIKLCIFFVIWFSDNFDLYNVKKYILENYIYISIILGLKKMNTNRALPC